MSDHALSIDGRWFDRIADGTKTAEVRIHDRDFQIGDTVTFTNTVYDDFTRFGPTAIREIDATITHILPASVFPVGLQPNYSVLSLGRIRNERTTDLTKDAS